MKAIKAVKPGFRYRDLGDIITTHANTNGFSVIKTYCGHGIGDLFHCHPNIPHYAKNKAVGTMQVCLLPLCFSAIPLCFSFSLLPHGPTSLASNPSLVMSHYAKNKAVGTMQVRPLPLFFVYLSAI